MSEKIHTVPQDPATLRAMQKLEKQFAEQDAKIEQKGGQDKALKQATAAVAQTVQRHGEAPLEAVKKGREIAGESPAIQAEAAKVAQLFTAPPKA